ncbi:MAG: hypothetical protein GY715_16550 [Planctomycetes bacterium]|nr:hypothetical protein [Planctomycetota bacterium]
MTAVTPVRRVFFRVDGSDAMVATRQTHGIERWARRTPAGDEAELRWWGDLRRDEAVTTLFFAAERAIGRRPLRLRVDLVAARSADSRTAACLVRIVGLARRADVEIEVRPSPEIDRWLDLCGVHALVTGGG